jgi:hypothetical protein
MQPRSEEFREHAAECEGLAKRYGSLIKEQYEQLARQWLFLAEQREAETFNRRTLVVRDPVLLCAPPRRESWATATGYAPAREPMERGRPIQNG